MQSHQLKIASLPKAEQTTSASYGADAAGSSSPNGLSSSPAVAGHREMSSIPFRAIHVCPRSRLTSKGNGTNKKALKT